MPKVSVIIPVYNSTGFIDEALQSVFAQTFKDYEIIIINDGSTDNTKQVIEKYSDKIRYFYQENRGPAAARNNGIKKAKGEYIAFIDSDDIWHPEKLKMQVSILDSNQNIGMVFTENSLFDENGVYESSLGKRKRLMHGNLAENIFLYSYVATPTVMIRREVFDNIGLFEESIKMAEDDNMWIRIASNYRVELIYQSLVSVRDHPNRMTRQNNDLFNCIQISIDMLHSNYGDNVRKNIDKVVPKKMGQIYFNTGYKYFENQNTKEARKAFSKSIKYCKWNWKYYLYYITSLMPSSIIILIRRLKRKLYPSFDSETIRTRRD
ncbi:MAG: glycosyltransferase family 2 protein [candidate division Zixibacteria bacterium]|nr:glycosyltransferase family 2 protein [candidate division Zixibacteria bacterium]